MASLKFEDEEADGLSDAEHGLVNLKLKAGQVICAICLEPTKKSRHRFGACCRKDVEAAEGDAKNQGARSSSQHRHCWEIRRVGPLATCISAVCELSFPCEREFMDGNALAFLLDSQ